eukprot:7383422-Prymnesium_polylepis.1
MIAQARLQSERKAWRKDHPHGFVAKPLNRADATQDIYKWQVKIPGKENSPWKGALLSATMQFSADYPQKPPVVQFDPIA